MRFLLMALTLIWLVATAEAQTSTPTATPTDTPTLGPTPYSNMNVGPVVHMRWAFTTGSTAATTIIDDRPVGNLACIAAVVLSPASASDTVSLLNGEGDEMFTTTISTLALTPGNLGPCVSTPVQVEGTGKASVGYWLRGTNSPP